MEQKTMVMLLKHVFTPPEIKAMSERLAKQAAALRNKQLAKETVVAQLTNEIKSIDAEVESLADKINNGFEHRDMNCPLKFDWKKGFKDAIHPETGEVAKTLEITETERQLKLEFDKNHPEAKK
ncbi:hypothetical protein CCP3SC15_5880001 [Gammaproteobacteria bacterium]